MSTVHRSVTTRPSIPGHGDIAGRCRDEYDLIRFALTWLPFGNLAHEHIWTEFGMTPARYVDRLAEALDSPIRRALHPESLQQLKRFVTAQMIDRRLGGVSKD